MMDPVEAREILGAATASLKDCCSLRDFVIAVKTGSEVACTMLDDIERRMIEVLRRVNEDAGDA
jgi:hypothetical protein